MIFAVAVIGFSFTACGIDENDWYIQQSEAQTVLSEIMPHFREAMHIFAPGLMNPEMTFLHIYQNSEGDFMIPLISDPMFPHILTTDDIRAEMLAIFTPAFAESTIFPMLFPFYRDMDDGLHRRIADFPTMWPWHDEIVAFNSLSDTRFEVEVATDAWGDELIRIIFEYIDGIWYIDYISWIFEESFHD